MSGLEMTIIILRVKVEWFKCSYLGTDFPPKTILKTRVYITIRG